MKANQEMQTNLPKHILLQINFIFVSYVVNALLKIFYLITNDG